MAPVKGHKLDTLAGRLRYTLALLSPWPHKPMTYGELAVKVGAGITEGAVKKWPVRGRIPYDAARAITEVAEEEGVIGLTVEWLMSGVGPRPEKGAAPRRDKQEPSEQGGLPALPDEVSREALTEKVSEALSLGLALTTVLHEVRESLARENLVRRADRLTEEEARARGEATLRDERRVSEELGEQPRVRRRARRTET